MPVSQGLCAGIGMGVFDLSPLVLFGSYSLVCMCNTCLNCLLFNYRWGLSPLPVLFVQIFLQAFCRHGNGSDGLPKVSG